MIFIEYLKFIGILLAVFILPGFSLLYLLVRSRSAISKLEYFVMSVGLSIAIVNLLILLLDSLGTRLSAGNVSDALFLSIALPFVLGTFPSWKVFLPSNLGRDKFLSKVWATNENKPAGGADSHEKLSSSQLKLIIIFLGIYFIIMGRFLALDIVPNNTDLGHHVYWAEVMRQGESIPVYDTDEVIVGEHIPFMVISLVSGIPLISSFPAIVLFFISSVGILAIYALSLRIFKRQAPALLSLAFLTLLYVSAAPFGKFVSGGVVGNVMGNLFIPLILLAMGQAFNAKKSEFLFIAIFLTQGLFYIHHLSTFLLLFIILAFFAFYLLFNLGRWRKIGSIIFYTAFSPLPLLAIGLFLATLGYVYVPSYISANSIETVAQAPVKDTHQGISFASLISSLGDWRTVLGLFGLFVFAYSAAKRKFTTDAHAAIFLAWPLILLALSFYPQFFLVDLPSRRVANYLALPFSLLAAYGLFTAYNFFSGRLSSRLRLLFFSVFLFALLLNGYADSLRIFLPSNSAEPTVQVYHASEYLAKNTTDRDVILKDHAAVPADSWIKFFFQRGYNYLLTRTFDYKYFDPTNIRETCTREMVISPDSTEGIECFEKTQTKYVFLAKNIDNYFFDLSDNFGKMYENDAVTIYKRITFQDEATR